jgi:pimeloyl-ACP methyl ester carboxylesterase
MKKKPTRKHADDLRAASALAVSATTEITQVVEDMHRTIASGPSILGRPLSGPAALLTSLVYKPIRKIAELVGVGLDVVIGELAPFLGESSPGPERDAVLAALNGVLGDYLAEVKNPLAIEMTFRIGGSALDLDSASLAEAVPEAKDKLLILVHGSSMNDRQWHRKGHDHGAALALEFGFSPVYLHYNSGRHVSTNGREFAALLDKLVNAWPTPVREIAIVGHSMGGLVARSACHLVDRESSAWLPKLRRLVCLGTPHHGAPLERGGRLLHLVLGVSAYSAPIGRLARIRSAGVTDLRFGNILDEHWEGRDRFVDAGDVRRGLSLPEGVDCFAIAGTLSKTMSKRLSSDGLVPVDSALGRHQRADLRLAFPEARQWISLSTDHLGLLDRREVFEKLRTWFA